MVKIAMVPLGLLDGIKHSVSRENLLNTLPKSPSHPISLSSYNTPKRRHRTGTSDSRKRAAVNVRPPSTETERQSVADPSLYRSENDVRLSEQAGRDSSPQAVGDLGSRSSLESSSTVQETGGHFEREDSFRSSGAFQVCSIDEESS